MPPASASRSRRVVESSAAAGLVLIGGNKNQTAWTFSCWYRRPSAAFGGHDVIASRTILQGEIIISEHPLLEAKMPDEGKHLGWAEDILRAFCDAPEAVRDAVLATSAAGDGGDNLDQEYSDEMKRSGASAKMLAGMKEEIEWCSKQPWRRETEQSITDSALKRCCSIFQMNAYSSGDDADKGALFELGCMLNHSCDSNVRKESSVADRRGSFVAKRDIKAGESLCTNYIGEYASLLSTPARREMLLASKLFWCRCAKCEASDDLLRRVPCPGCHPRTGSEHELALPVALDGVDVRYARPSSAKRGAHWVCDHCPDRQWKVEQVIPGPSSMGGLTGREWERVLECNVLHFEQRALQMLAQGLGNSIADEAKGMHELVARSVGSKHWTTSRLAEIVDGVRLQRECLCSSMQQ